MRSPFQFGAARDDDPETWKLKGACRKRKPDGTLVHNPELFFPEGRAEHYQQPGKRVCVGCPILARCRAWALTHDEFGIWGGLSEYDRRRMKRQDRQQFRNSAGRLRAG